VSEEFAKARGSNYRDGYVEGWSGQGKASLPLWKVKPTSPDLWTISTDDEILAHWTIIGGNTISRRPWKAATSIEIYPGFYSGSGNRFLSMTISPDPMDIGSTYTRVVSNTSSSTSFHYKPSFLHQRMIFEECLMGL
jgi:hypothetical protein